MHIHPYPYHKGKMLTNKTCIVTGSTAGIGKAIAKAFVKEGAFVFINGRSEKSVNDAFNSLVEEGLARDLMHGIVADISTNEGAEHFFAAVEATGREIDVLVNNMGIFSVKDFFEITDDVWRQYFDVNVLSTVRFCRKYLKPMLERNAGRVLIISSECGMRPIADMLHYATTKATQINLARGLAELTKGTKVTVNSILPG
jgi:NAD(P)-dependent dehydrogenase (short-subunit alcohol dehydrogenase family)